MIVVSEVIGCVPIADIEVHRSAAIGVQMRCDHVPVEREADDRRVKVTPFGLVPVGVSNAIGDRMVMISDGQIDVPAAIIERRDRIGTEDRVQRGRAVDADSR